MICVSASHSLGCWILPKLEESVYLETSLCFCVEEWGFCSSSISDAATFVFVSVLLTLKLSIYTCSLWWTSREGKPKQVDSEAIPDLWTADKKPPAQRRRLISVALTKNYLHFVPNSYLIPPCDITLFEKWSVVRVVSTYWHNKKDKSERACVQSHSLCYVVQKADMLYFLFVVMNKTRGDPRG